MRQPTLGEVSSIVGLPASGFLAGFLAYQEAPMAGLIAGLAVAVSLLGCVCGFYAYFGRTRAEAAKDIAERAKRAAEADAGQARAEAAAAREAEAAALTCAQTADAASLARAQAVEATAAARVRTVESQLAAQTTRLCELALHGAALSVRAFSATLEGCRLTIRLSIWQLLPIPVEIRDFRLHRVTLSGGAEVLWSTDEIQEANDTAWRELNSGGVIVVFVARLSEEEVAATCCGVTEIRARSFTARTRERGALDAPVRHLTFGPQDGSDGLFGVCRKLHTLISAEADGENPQATTG